MPFQVGHRRAQTLLRRQRWRGLAFKAEEIDVLLKAAANRRLPVPCHLLAQEQHAARTLAGRHHRLGLCFDGRPERRLQVRIRDERPARQHGHDELASILRVAHGQFVIASRERPAAKPRQRFERFRRRALSLAEFRQQFVGALQVVFRERRPHVGHNRRLTREQLG